MSPLHLYSILSFYIYATQFFVESRLLSIGKYDPYPSNKGLFHFSPLESHRNPRDLSVENEHLLDKLIDYTSEPSCKELRALWKDALESLEQSAEPSKKEQYDQPFPTFEPEDEDVYGKIREIEPEFIVRDPAVDIIKMLRQRSQNKENENESSYGSLVRYRDEDSLTKTPFQQLKEALKGSSFEKEDQKYEDNGYIVPQEKSVDKFRPFEQLRYENRWNDLEKPINPFELLRDKLRNSRSDTKMKNKKGLRKKNTRKRRLNDFNSPSNTEMNAIQAKYYERNRQKYIKTHQKEITEDDSENDTQNEKFKLFSFY